MSRKSELPRRTTTLNLSATSTEEAIGDTAAGVVIGATPELWMAPEIIKERHTARGWKKADIWSLGCTGEMRRRMMMMMMMTECIAVTLYSFDNVALSLNIESNTLL